MDNRAKLRKFLKAHFGLEIGRNIPLPTHNTNGLPLVYFHGEPGSQKKYACPACVNNPAYYLANGALANRADTYPLSNFPPESGFRVNTEWGLQCGDCGTWLVPEVLACDDCGQTTAQGVSVRLYTDVGQPVGGLQLCDRCREYAWNQPKITV